MTHTPGSEQGWMFSKYKTSVQCPQQVSAWVYWTGQIGEDDSLKVTCGTSEYPHIVHDSVYIAHISECSGPIPTVPHGAMLDYDGSDAAGTLVTYTCSDDSKVFSMVSCEQYTICELFLLVISTKTNQIPPESPILINSYSPKFLFFNLILQCGSGQWQPSTVACNSHIETSTVLFETTSASHLPPSCELTTWKNYQLKGKKLGKPTKTKKLADCVKNCEV